MDLLTFILVSIGIIILPGPNVLVVVSTSLSHGRTRGLQTVAGTSIAMIIQLSVAGLSTLWFVTSLASGFFWLKWAGVAYLLYLGINNLLSINRKEEQQISASGSIQRGFWVSLTNPKTILFFSAFLPQFVSPEGNYLGQIALLSFVFWLLAVVLDSAYALLADKVASYLKHKDINRAKKGASGLLYLGAGAALAATQRN